jgi:cell division FtsZ-interacting protein ZapD
LTGTSSQIEWAEQIRLNVDLEFDRVAKAFQTVADRQSGIEQAETQGVIAILEEKRAGTMAHDRAGYFIRDWQELNDQVRQMIHKDPRYQAIRAGRMARAKE